MLLRRKKRVTSPSGTTLQRTTTGKGWFALKPDAGSPPVQDFVPPGQAVDVLRDFRDDVDGQGESLYFNCDGVLLERTVRGRVMLNPTPGPRKNIDASWNEKYMTFAEAYPSWGEYIRAQEQAQWDGQEHYVDERQEDVIGDPDALPQARFDSQDFTAVRMLRGSHG